MTSPAISVILPHYNDLDGLDLCLNALQVQTVPSGQFEIIVADNMSSMGEDAVRERIAGRARLTIAAEPGAGPARNAGVSVARGDIFAFTDSDCVPEPGWLQAGIDALTRCDFAGGRMTVLEPSQRPMTGAEAFETVFAFNNAAYIHVKSFTVTANLFCRRAVFDAVGAFRTGVSEDMDWCHRARDVGYRIGYAEHAVVGHPPRPDWPALRKKWRRINAESYGLVAQSHIGRLRWIARSWALPLSVIAHVPRIVVHPRLSGSRERIAALATLTRLRLWRMTDAHRLAMERR